VRIRKFAARNMPEALQKVRAELGDSAVILHSKSLSGKGLKGLFRSAQVEVTAAADVIPPEDGPPTARTRSPSFSSGRNARSVRESLTRLEQQVTELSARVDERSSNGKPEAIRPEWLSVYRALSEKGIALSIAQEIVVRASQLATEKSTHARVEAVRKAVEERFKTCDPLMPGNDLPTVAVFIGPTGVGKTTTLAKIAASFHQQGHSVALVTADTYRLAAVEQLRRFAEILGIPVEVIYEARELPAALRRHRNAEVILIDTAGRSQNHHFQMEELGEMLGQVRGAEIFLLMAATAAPATFEHQLRRFTVFAPQKVILTKVDELPSGGSLLDTVTVCPLPIAYITNGQEIPDDYFPADGEQLARLAMSESMTRAAGGGVYARAG
jgi:flagellar biosynthesis protein FlhF